MRCWSAIEATGRPRRSSPPTFSAGRLRPSIRTGRNIWGSREYLLRTIEAIHKHWSLVACGRFAPAFRLSASITGQRKRARRPPTPSKPLGRRVGRPQVLIESLILVAHDLLQQGQARRLRCSLGCLPGNARYWRSPDAFNLSIQNTTIE